MPRLDGIWTSRRQRSKAPRAAVREGGDSGSAVFDQRGGHAQPRQRKAQQQQQQQQDARASQAAQHRQRHPPPRLRAPQK
jgi:hypothetical protein